jgi:hypothetical protein
MAPSWNSQFKVSHISVIAVLLAALLGSSARPDNAVAAMRIASAGAEFCRRIVLRVGGRGLDDRAARSCYFDCESIIGYRQELYQ